MNAILGLMGWRSLPLNRPTLRVIPPSDPLIQPARGSHLHCPGARHTPGNWRVGSHSVTHCHFTDSPLTFTFCMYTNTPRFPDLSWSSPLVKTSETATNIDQASTNANPRTKNYCSFYEQNTHNSLHYKLSISVVQLIWSFYFILGLFIRSSTLFPIAFCK